MCSLNFTCERVHVFQICCAVSEIGRMKNGIIRQIHMFRIQCEKEKLVQSQEIDHHVYCTVTRFRINVDYIICSLFPDSLQFRLFSSSTSSLRVFRLFVSSPCIAVVQCDRKS